MGKQTAYLVKTEGIDNNYFEKNRHLLLVNNKLTRAGLGGQPKQVKYFKFLKGSLQLF